MPQNIAKAETSVLQPVPAIATRAQQNLLNVVLVISATFFVALCAKVSLPLPGTIVPLTIQNFAVLLVGLALGPRRGAAAMALYLMEGAMGFPVFNPHGLGGVAQIVGPTGGYLIAYPFVAMIAGWGFEAGKRTYSAAVLSTAIAELVLFTSGVSWLTVVGKLPFIQASALGLYPFVPAEVLKVAAAASIATAWYRWRAKQN